MKNTAAVPLDTPTKLIVRVLQDLVARDRFAEYADLIEALKVRCARLRIPYHGGLMTEAIAQLERGGTMPLITRPRPSNARVDTRVEDDPPPSKDEARDILQRLGCQVKPIAPATWRDPEQTRRDYEAARARAYEMGGCGVTGTDLAQTLFLHLRAVGLPLPVREYHAIPGHRFRCDLAWPDRRLSVEVDGGELQQGRHNRAAGMASDCEKQNLLVLAGWRCLRFTGGQVKAGVALRVVTEALRCL